jgi:TldD protein
MPAGGDGLKDLARRALDHAHAAGATYADIRMSRTRHQSVSVKNGNVEGLVEDYSEGFGVRVVVDGAWGFACSSLLSGAQVDSVVAQAVRIAHASARVHPRPVDLGPPVSEQGTYRGPLKIDPFGVPLSDKVELLLRAETALHAHPEIRVGEASCECTHWTKLFCSSEGAEVEQEAWETGGSLEAVAVSDGDMQRRSYPNSVGREVGQGGWELVVAMDLVRAAPRLAEEAAALLRAEQCPPDVTTVVLDASQVALQVHESCGHPTELDRVFGTEAAYAGTSFMTPDLLGQLRYGSDQVTIVADATVPGGLGTFGFDDEGVRAQRVNLIDKGLFVGYLTSRETATQLRDHPAMQASRGPRNPGEQSMGSMRADGWGRIPLIRMTNINLEPGESSLAEMIATTRSGIYMVTNKSWSIDDRRLNFQFATELAYQIKDGKLGKMYRNPSYAGITPDFWNSCDAIGGKDEWRMYGVINCGKGQPGQTMRVGHGAAPARFQNVQVGIS